VEKGEARVKARHLQVLGNHGPQVKGPPRTLVRGPAGISAVRRLNYLM
jgi:hypothetical protein